MIPCLVLPLLDFQFPSMPSSFTSCAAQPPLPSPSLPLLRATSNSLPPAIGDPMNRNLSNSPSQPTSISLKTAPSTASTANHAFTRTGLIPRALFFGIGYGNVPPIVWRYAAKGFTFHADSHLRA